MSADVIDFEKKRAEKKLKDARELAKTIKPGAPGHWQIVLALALLTAAAWWICREEGKPLCVD